MYKLLFSSLVLVFLTSCSGSTDSDDTETAEIDSNYCDCQELVFDDGYNHFYRFDRREGFTGLCEEFYRTEQKKLEKNFLDGKLNCKMISYHNNGQVNVEQQFDMNFQEGEKITYTITGKVMFHAIYKRGQQIEVVETHPQLDIND
jgi:hypothetical protein